MAKIELSAERLKERRQQILTELKKIIVGQEEAIDQVLTAFFSGGHSMITGLPGVAKTLLIESLGRVMDLRFKRIQFTPDLMPSDITGTEILEEDKSTGHRELKFVKGPVFANIVMADEINRTPPKTQASLLEAMQEKQVTIGGRTYKIDLPFFVLATQIPLEQEGTYPLPEAQQDRFMFNVLMPYLTPEQEAQAVKWSTGKRAAALTPIIGGPELLAYQKMIRDTEVPKELFEYIVDLVAASRPKSTGAPDFVKEYIAWGAGLRASQNIVLGAKGRASLMGRRRVALEDVKFVLVPVLRHRLGLNFRAEVDKVSVEDVILKLIAHTRAPAA